MGAAERASSARIGAHAIAAAAHNGGVSGTGSSSRMFAAKLRSVLGGRLRVRAHEEIVDGDGGADVVVTRPPRWSCLWRWRTDLGRLLRAAGETGRSHVVIAAEAATRRPLRSCLIAIAPHDVSEEMLPPWLAAFDRIELAVSLDASCFAMSIAGTPVPTAFLGAGYGVAAAQVDAERVVLRCVDRLGDVRVTHHVGNVEATIAEVMRARSVDIVFLANARHMLFLGSTLKHILDKHGVSVVVPPAPLVAGVRRHILAPLP